MKLFVLFGLPGAGKTYTGKIAEKFFGYHLYEGDQDMSNAYKKAVMEETMTDALRQDFFDRLIENIGKLQEDNIIVAQTFIKEKFRKQFLKAFPNAKFILVQASDDIREKRLLHLNRFALSLEKWRRMENIFEKPGIHHETIDNNKEGEDVVRKQLQKLMV
jgi:gluconate kinase